MSIQPTTPNPDYGALNPRQHRIAELAGLGYTNSEIGSELGITEGAVKSALHLIFDRLGIWNRVELANRLSRREELESAELRIEGARLQELNSRRILDTPREPDFDDLVALVRYVCQTPIASITLIDKNRQWFKAEQGLGVRETSRNLSFCAHVIRGSQMMVVHDATRDERFRQNPLVTADPRIRFYAGVPLLTDDGYGLGTVCAIDRVPRNLKVDTKEALQAIGRIAVRLLGIIGTA